MKIRYIYIILFLFISIRALAIPEITKIDFVHATCPLNGEIRITVANTLGSVTYELERVNAPEGEFNFTLGPHPDNIFTDLPPGEYIVKVYDASTGSTPVVSTGNIIEKKYDKIFAMDVPKTGTSSTNRFCQDNGTLSASGTGGTRPYTAKIVNTDTNVETVLTGAANSYIISFTGLPKGNYTVEMWDQCGTGALYDGTVLVNSDGTALDNIKLTSIVKNETYSFAFSSNSTTDCGVIRMLAYYYDFIITGFDESTNSTVSDIQTTYRTRLEYCMEYPLGTGTTGRTWRVLNSSAYFTGQINDYDPTIDQQFRIHVRNPCKTNEEPIVSPIFTIPKVERKFQISSSSGYRPGPIYDDFCSIPTVGGFRVDLTTTGGGFSAYNCENNYEVTVEGNTNGFNKKYIWGPTQGSVMNFTDIPLGDKYIITVRDNNTNAVLTSPSLEVDFTDVPTKPISLRSNSIIHYTNGYNYGITCDFDTYALYTYRGTSYIDGLVRTNYYYSINTSQKLIFSIVNGPEGVTRSPIEGTYTQFLWTDLPAGEYEIEVDYGCRKETFPVKIIQTVTGFDASEEVIINSSGICGNNSISVLGYYLDTNGNPYDGTSGLYYYNARAFDSNNVVVGTTASSVRSNTRNTITGLSAGTYTVRFYANYNNSSNICYYSKEIVVEIPEYSSPNIDIVNSGGITCHDGGKADLTVIAAGTNTPFQYRYKIKDASDDTYSAWQYENIFEDLYPGRYTVQVWNTCYSYITQDLTVYNYGQQFVGLIGYVGDEEDGAVCEGKPVTITVLSIGPVVSYQWYKTDIESGVEIKLEGETGPQYFIDSASDEHIGKYTVEINNGKCDLRSSVYILKVLAPAETPTLTSTGDCVYNGNPLTLTVTTKEENPTYQWYRNNEILNGVSGSTYTATQAGVYTVTVTPPVACPSDFSNAIVISLPELYWDNTKQSNNWNDYKNWLKPDGTAANTIPCDETAVTITGSTKTTGITYPSLDEVYTPTDLVGMPVCNTITFQYGAEIAHPHRLLYNKAYIQYNWGYYNTDLSSAPDDPETENYYGDSAPMLKRDKWYALSAPLKKMASGDFGLAGYPLTWQAKFEAKNTSGIAVTDCDFSIPFATNAINLAMDKNYNAIAIKIAGYDNIIGKNDHRYFESLKGIIEIPYFENAEKAPYYPNHSYDRFRGESSFYYFNTSTLQTIYSPVGTMKRGEEAYRFVFEDDNTGYVKTLVIKGENVPAYAITVTRESSDSRMVMIGNPFMSSINSENFYEANSNVLAAQSVGYFTFDSSQQWKQNAYASINSIAPLQAFVVTLGENQTSTTIYFPLEGTYALTGAGNRAEPMMLPMGSSLYVKTANSEQESDFAVLKTSEYGETIEDVNKIIFPESHSIPEVFFIAPENKKMNLIQMYKDDIKEIALGIKTSDKTNTLKIAFENVEEFTNTNQVFPVLVDKLLGVEQNLVENNVYYFKQTRGSEDDKYTDTERFKLRLLSIDDMEESDDKSIDIQYTNGRLTIKSVQNLTSVRVYDAQGQLIHSEPKLNATTYVRDMGLRQGVYIVMTTVESGMTKTKKIITNKD